MSYYGPDKEEWDDLILERRESRRHHYDEVPLTDSGFIDESDWEWEDSKNTSYVEYLAKNRIVRRKPSNGWDW